jgi:predicted nucleotidyltransferase
MSAVPHACITERYFPEDKLQTLFKSQALDSLQAATLDLVSLLARQTGVSKDDFGVTGSLLTDIHNPRFSDIDLTVYGRTNAWKMKEGLTEGETFVRGRSEQRKRRTLERWVNNYHMTVDEAEEIYHRRWNYGRFNSQVFSIHPVRKDEEITTRYCDVRFFPHGIVEGRAEITDVEESLFLPGTYQVKRYKTTLGVDRGEIGEVVSYDGLFAGLFDCGERIVIRGKLEEVIEREGGRRLRVLVGSPEAQGRDYIKPAD